MFHQEFLPFSTATSSPRIPARRQLAVVGLFPAVWTAPRSVLNDADFCGLAWYVPSETESYQVQPLQPPELGLFWKPEKLVDSRTTNGLRKSTKVRTLEDIPSLNLPAPLITKRPWFFKMTDPDPTTKSWGSHATNIKKSLFRGINSEWTPKNQIVGFYTKGFQQGVTTWLVVYLPLWKIWKSVVSWDDYFQYMEKWKMFQTTNQQPMTIWWINRSHEITEQKNYSAGRSYVKIQWASKAGN